ncbi:hypothetical protein PA598K_05741 [Paenibacillus sp. 598K]|nr:hypothetical protein PA598K_05741 [Paenibacillus sp. 598K]
MPGLLLFNLHAYAVTNQNLYDEMHEPHESYAHGLPPEWDWAQGPTYKDLAFPTTTYTPISPNPHTWDAVVPWGAVYEAAEGSSSVNTRVAVKDLQSYYLSYDDNQWHELVFQTAPDGAYFTETLDSTTQTPAPRIEADGSLSVVPGNGKLYHFWPDLRTQVTDPADVKAIYTSYQAKLVKDNPAGVDDRASANFLAHASTDIWYSTSAPYDNLQTNGDLGIGRFRYVTNDYQYFSAYSARSGVNILTVPAPPTGDPTPTPGYTEDFNDDLAQNWTLPAGISVSGGHLHTDSWSIHPFSTYDGATFSGTYTYEIDVKTIAGSDGNRTKILFNAADSANYYALDLGGGSSPNIYLKKVIGGTESTIATSSAHTSIMDTGAYTTIAIAYASGGNISVTAAKGGTTTTLFSNVNDTSRTSGKIGVTVAASVTQFDNVTVTLP